MNRLEGEGGEPAFASSADSHRRSAERLRAMSAIDPAHRVFAALVGLAIQGSALFVAGALGGAAYFLPVIVLAPIASAYVHAKILFSLDMRSRAQALFDVKLAGIIALVVLVSFQIEGIVCVLMTLPLLLLFWLAGVMLASIGRERVSPQRKTMLLIVALVPGGSTAALAPFAEPAPREVVTVVEIDAPPEAIWKYVTNFPEIPADADVPWTFSLGYPRPIRCDIEGSGVGAMRYCVFTGGVFDERVMVWDEGRELSFEVTGQPKKIDHFIHCTKGQFLLERLPNGKTRVTGTTWYGISMDPSFYFGLWSDKLIHDIHVGVLEHIKRLAEGEVRGP